MEPLVKKYVWDFAACKSCDGTGEAEVLSFGCGCFCGENCQCPPKPTKTARCSECAGRGEVLLTCRYCDRPGDNWVGDHGYYGYCFEHFFVKCLRCEKNGSYPTTLGPYDGASYCKEHQPKGGWVDDVHIFVGKDRPLPDSTPPTGHFSDGDVAVWVDPETGEVHCTGSPVWTSAPWEEHWERTGSEGVYRARLSKALTANCCHEHGPYLGLGCPTCGDTIVFY